MSAALKKALKDAVMIVAAAAVLGFLANLANPRGYTPVGKSTLENESVVHISAEEAKIKYDAGSALFLDARSAEQFRAQRIKGALSVPAEPESYSLSKIREHFGLIKEGKELVLYCGGSSCGDSEALARRLAGLGYRRHIYILDKGISSWTGALYPVEGEEEQ